MRELRRFTSWMKQVCYCYEGKHWCPQCEPTGPLLDMPCDMKYCRGSSSKVTSFDEVDSFSLECGAGVEEVLRTDQIVVTTVPGTPPWQTVLEAGKSHRPYLIRHGIGLFEGEETTATINGREVAVFHDGTARGLQVGLFEAFHAPHVNPRKLRDRTWDLLIRRHISPVVARQLLDGKKCGQEVGVAYARAAYYWHQRASQRFSGDVGMMPIVAGFLQVLGELGTNVFLVNAACQDLGLPHPPGGWKHGNEAERVFRGVAVIMRMLR